MAAMQPCSSQHGRRAASSRLQHTSNKVQRAPARNSAMARWYCAPPNRRMCALGRCSCTITGLLSGPTNAPPLRKHTAGRQAEGGLDQAQSRLQGGRARASRHAARAPVTTAAGSFPKLPNPLEQAAGAPDVLVRQRLSKALGRRGHGTAQQQLQLRQERLAEAAAFLLHGQSSTQEQQGRERQRSAASWRRLQRHGVGCL